MPFSDRESVDSTDLPPKLVEGFLKLCAGDFSYRLERNFARDEADTVAFFFNTVAEELERIILTTQAKEQRLRESVEAISAVLLKVAAGDLRVEAKRDYVGDDLDVLVYLVNTTISELAMLLEEKEQRRFETQLRLEQLVLERTDQLQQANGQLKMQLGEIQLLQAQLQEQAIRDPLTKLFNRGFLEETLAHQLQRAIRDKSSICVLMLDVDHFKLFNDLYGHAAGDALLRGFGALLKAHVRSSDVAARYGGEEFTILMPAAALEDGQRRAELLCKTIKNLRVTYKGKDLQITTSIGLAAYPNHGETPDALLYAADTALYAAKQAGRDRAEVFDPNML